MTNQAARIVRIATAFTLAAVASTYAAETPWVSVAAGGKLAYKADPRGDTVPDFSNCGYGGGGVAIPEAPVKLTLEPSKDAKGDDTARIQKALDAVGGMPI